MNPLPRSALPLPSQMQGNLSTSKRGSIQIPLDAFTPQTHTRTPTSPYAHIHCSAHTLYIWKKTKFNHPPHLFDYLLVSLPSVCPGAVGSGSPGDFCDVKWKGRFAFAALRPLGQQFRCPRQHTTERKMPPPKGVYVCRARGEPEYLSSA